MWIGHEETPSAAVWELHPIVLETSPWACRACVTQEYFSRFQAVNTFLKMQVCDFCFSMASHLTVSLTLGPSHASRCFSLVSLLELS